MFSLVLRQQVLNYLCPRTILLTAARAPCAPPAAGFYSQYYSVPSERGHDFMLQVRTIYFRLNSLHVLLQTDVQVPQKTNVVIDYQHVYFIRRGQRDKRDGSI